MGKMLDRKSEMAAIPPLVEGDRLTLDEFWRRYEADERILRAELINGVVFVNSRRVIVDGKETVVPPISRAGHGRPQSRVLGWLTFFQAYTLGVAASSPSSMRMSDRTALEPDAILEILADFKSSPAAVRGDDLDGIPELVVEVANTSAGRDLSLKFDAYQAEGVKEYLVWRTEPGIIDWFVLKRKQYVRLEPDAAGVLRSETFPGLWLDVAAIRDSDMAKVFEVLKLGLATPEHAAFVAKLQAVTKRKKK